MPWVQRRPADEPKALYTVSEFNKLKLRQGSVYGVEGYVVDSVMCSLCPQDTTCAPCREEYVIVSDMPRRSSSDPKSISDRELRITIHGYRSRRLKKWSKYQFEVRPVLERSYSPPFRDVVSVELVTWRDGFS